MVSSSAISPVTLASLTGITPVSFQALSGATATSALPPLASSSVVQLSALGQVLSSGSSLVTSIQALQQTRASDATPETVQAQVKTFVAAFNQLEASLGSAQPLLGASSSDALVGQLSTNLTAAATNPSGPDSVNLSSLQSIGISLQVTTSPTTGEPTLNLQLDQDALNAAATANPAGTLNLLNQATQPVLQTVSAFETLATQSVSSLLSSTGSNAASDLLTNLSSGASPGNSALITPDLSALGVDTSTTDSTTNAIANPDITPDTTAAERVRTSIATQAASVSTPATTVQAAAVVADTTATNADTGLAATTSATNAAATATDQAASVDAGSGSTFTAQDVEQDPSQGNILFNPFYAASTAAFQQNALASPTLTGANASPFDLLPPPVAPIIAIRAISAYA